MILFLCIFSKKIIRERCNSYVGISSSKVYDKEKLEMIQMSRNERKMNDCISFPFLKLWQNSHNIKFTTLILLSVQFNGIYIHVVMQTTIHPHNSFHLVKLKLYTFWTLTLHSVFPKPLANQHYNFYLYDIDYSRYHISGITWYLFSCDWLISFSIMSSFMLVTHAE